jgi:D-3-phosphoglycerate dehydrogenase / 2-oxoglutarate reductase
MSGLRRVLVSEEIEGVGMDQLKAKYEVIVAPAIWQNVVQLEKAVREIEALIVRNQTQVTESLLVKAKDLRVIGRAGAGYDNVNIDAASQAGVVVCYSPEENAVSVAEHVFALLLSLARKVPGADQSVKAGKWERKKYHGTEIFGKTLGILGLGKIGFRVALRAKAFGMRILGYDAYLSSTHLHVTESGVSMVSLEKLLDASDFLTIHLPLNRETRGLLNSALLQRMKPTALLINTSRGEILVERDLVQALRDRTIAGAALDVLEKEPPLFENSLFGLDNVILTPHTAGLTHEAQEKVVQAIAEDVDRVLSGQPALRYVNFSMPRR